MVERERETPGYRTQSPDTEEWAERLLFAHWRNMAPWEKAALVSELCQSLHELSLRGLEVRFPEATREALELRAASLRLGSDLVRRVNDPGSDQRS